MDLGMYPDTGNVSIVVRTRLRESRVRVERGEQIVLAGPDIIKLAHYLSELPDKGLIKQIEFGTDYLEATLLQAVGDVIGQAAEPSELTTKIMEDWNAYLADSAPTCFNPVNDLFVLGLDAQFADQAQLVTLSSPVNSPEDGDAVVRTPAGDVAVSRRGAYLRASWINPEPGT
jgi:hypothetical protein